MGRPFRDAQKSIQECATLRGGELATDFSTIMLTNPLRATI
jgi:hypothetical protein